jgi:hypothetical protein
LIKAFIHSYPHSQDWPLPNAIKKVRVVQLGEALRVAAIMKPREVKSRLT